MEKSSQSDRFDFSLLDKAEQGRHMLVELPPIDTTTPSAAVAVIAAWQTQVSDWMHATFEAMPEPPAYKGEIAALRSYLWYYSDDDFRVYVGEHWGWDYFG